MTFLQPQWHLTYSQNSWNEVHVEQDVSNLHFPASKLIGGSDVCLSLLANNQEVTSSVSSYLDQ